MDFDEQLGLFLLLDDPMKVSLIGFSIIESQLEKLITLSLSEDHKVEIKKMNARMKVDLVIALGTFPNEYKGILLKLSKLRNEYAHQVYINSQPNIINQIESSLSNSQRDALKSSQNCYADTEILRYAIVSTILVIRQCAYNLSYRLKQKLNEGSFQKSFSIIQIDMSIFEKKLRHLIEEKAIHKCPYEALNKLKI